MNLINNGILRRIEQRELASNDHAQPAVIVQQHSTTARILSEHLQEPPKSDVWINFERRFGHLDYGGKYHSSTIYGGVEKMRGKNWRDGLFVSYGSTNFSSNTAGAEIGGEYKRNLHDENKKVWQVSPFIGVTASYFRQSAYNEKITDIFKQRVDFENNFYAALKPGIEFRSELGNGGYSLRIGCEYALIGTHHEINFNYANYDRAVYKMNTKTDKFHWTFGLNGTFNLSQNWQLSADTFFRNGAHDRDFSAAIQIEHNF